MTQPSLSSAVRIVFVALAAAAASAPVTASHGSLICIPGGPYIAECSGADLSYELDGSASRDPSGNPILYHWETDCPGATFDNPDSARPRLLVPFQPGCENVCEVELKVDNRKGKTDHCHASIVVRDTLAPALSAPPVAGRELWPPNHRQVCIDRSDLGDLAVTDACDDDATWLLVDCTIDETARPGACQVLDGGTRVCARVERNGNGDGRSYRLFAAAEDACGNRSPGVEVFEWTVPHDRGQDR